MAVNVNARLTDALESTTADTFCIPSGATPGGVASLPLTPSRKLSHTRVSARQQIRLTCCPTVSNEPSLSRCSLKQRNDSDTTRRRVDVQQLVHGLRTKKEQHHWGRGCETKDQRPDDDSVGPSPNFWHQYHDNACGVCDVDQVKNSATRAAETKGSLAGIAVNTGLLTFESRLTSAFGIVEPRSTNTDRWFSHAGRSLARHHITGERSFGIEAWRLWGHDTLRGYGVAGASRLPTCRTLVTIIHPWIGSSDSQDDGEFTARSSCYLPPATAHFATGRCWSGAAVPSNLQGARS